MGGLMYVRKRMVWFGLVWCGVVLINDCRSLQRSFFVFFVFFCFFAFRYAFGIHIFIRVFSVASQFCYC